MTEFPMQRLRKAAAEISQALNEGAQEFADDPQMLALLNMAKQDVDNLSRQLQQGKQKDVQGK